MSSCLGLFNFLAIKTGVNTFLFHLLRMISAIPFHRQALQSLAKYDIEPSPANLLRVLETLGRRWDLSTDELVETAFCKSSMPKNLIKIELIFPITGRKKGATLVRFVFSNRYLSGQFWLPICLLGRQV